MDLVKREDVMKIIAKTHYEPNGENDPTKEVVMDMIASQLDAIEKLPHYNPVSQMDKLRSELSEILDSYRQKKEPQKIHIGTNWKTHDDLLDAYRYAKTSVDLAEFEKIKNANPPKVVLSHKPIIRPLEYPIKKFKVVAKGTLGLVDHYVYADDVSEDENGCYFWIEDKKVGHFTNAAAYYEVKDNESDIN